MGAIPPTNTHFPVGTTLVVVRRNSNLTKK